MLAKNGSARPAASANLDKSSTFAPRNTPSVDEWSLRMLTSRIQRSFSKQKFGIYPVCCCVVSSISDCYSCWLNKLVYRLAVDSQGPPANLIVLPKTVIHLDTVINAKEYPDLFHFATYLPLSALVTNTLDADILFLGVDGIDIRYGHSTANLLEAKC